MTPFLTVGLLPRSLHSCSLAEQDADASAFQVAGDDVEFAVAVDVADSGEPRLTGAQRKLAAAKATVSVIQQQRQGETRRQLLPAHGTGGRGGRDNVRPAVVVYVAQGRRIRAGPDGEGGGRA